MPTVFILQHIRKASDDFDDIKMIGVYDTLEAAKDAIERLNQQPGFKEIPGDYLADGEGFSIEAYEIGKDHWTEGFVKK